MSRSVVSFTIRTLDGKAFGPCLKAKNRVGGLRSCYDFTVKNQIRRISATRAAREFSKLLDSIQLGAEFVIERHSEAVAEIGPSGQAPRKLSDCLALNLRKSSARADPDFGLELMEIIRGAATEEPPVWE